MSINSAAVPVAVATIVGMLASITGCTSGERATSQAWASVPKDFGSRRLKDVPVIRVKDAGEIRFDGTLNDPAWKDATVHDRFGLSKGTGLLAFPTSLRILKSGRVLWLGLDCTIPPDKTGKVPDDAMERELIEVWIDKGPSRVTFYQIMFKPDGRLVTSWVPEGKLAKGFQVKSNVRENGYTAEVRIDLDALDDFGPVDSPNVGFNLARSCGGGWASLAQVVAHVHKPNQFWLLDLAGTETEVPPKIAYRDPFKPGADVRAIAKTLLDAWKQADFPHDGKLWARVQATMNSLEWKISRDEKWAWGCENQLAIVAWRALTSWRLHRGHFAMPESVEMIVKQLADDTPSGVRSLPMPSSGGRIDETYLPVGIDRVVRGGKWSAFGLVASSFGTPPPPKDLLTWPSTAPFPPTRWREDAYISDLDATAQPYAIFVPEQYDGKTPMPLIVFLHGSGTTHFGEGAILERYEDPRAPYIMVRVKARWCNGYGPVAMRDVRDVIDDVCKHYAIDFDRIYLAGYSAGGFAAPKLAMREPHRFAGIVSISAYMRENRPGNLANVPTLIVHGFTDPVVVYDANQGASILRMRDAGVPVECAVFPATGHGVTVIGYEDWLLKHRARGPRKVSCFTDEDNPAPLRNYWVSILALARPERQAGIRAEITDDGTLVARTGNVEMLALYLPAIAREPGRLPRRLLIDDQTLDLPEMEFCVLKRDGYTWKVESFISSHWPDRTRYVAGGVLNLLREGSPMIVVGGELAPFAADLKGTRFFGNRSLSKLPVRKDTEVSEYELRSHHLILIGGAKLNRVVRKFEEENADWPLPRGEGGFVLDEETTVDPAKSLVGVVTLNPADRRLRTWTFYCDDPKAFHAESAILKNSTRRRRQPDITVIDVEKNELTEHRVLDKKWKPYPKPMGNE